MSSFVRASFCWFHFLKAGNNAEYKRARLEAQTLILKTKPETAHDSHLSLALSTRQRLRGRLVAHRQKYQRPKFRLVLRKYVHQN